MLALKAKVPTAAYDRWVIWIDAERFVTLKEEMYARLGKMLKSSVTLEVTPGNYLLGVVLGYGGEATIEAPPDVAAALRERIAELQAVYITG